MYHSVIGKKLIAILNSQDNTNVSVRDFFDKKYVPLFFGNSRLLQNVNNSPFDQTFTTQKRPYTPLLLEECLAKVRSNVSTKAPDASFYIGGPAAGCVETTSGQVTSMPLPANDEDIYASWIGAALGLTVEGGMTLLIDAEDVLLETYRGWFKYREYLSQTPGLKPFQINAWNGQWVAKHLRGLSHFSPDINKEGAALETQKWVQLIFALSFHFREGQIDRLLAYIYSLGQSNTTLGFVQINLRAANRLVDTYRQYFTVPEGMPHAAFEQLYNTEESFRAACAGTEIGLAALRPKDVFRAKNALPKAPQANDKVKKIAFDSYQTWIIAMLNNKELLTRAEDLAAAIYGTQKSSNRGKSDNDNLIDKILAARNKRDFIEELTVLLSRDGSNGALFEQVVDDLLSMTPENVPLFLTLLRFKYASLKAKS